jgi:hypothetical protein
MKLGFQKYIKMVVSSINLGVSDRGGVNLRPPIGLVAF